MSDDSHVEDLYEVLGILAIPTVLFVFGVGMCLWESRCQCVDEEGEWYE